MNQKQRFYVGTYTEPILFGTGEILQGKGKGIYILELDRIDKKMIVKGIINEVKNPSFLAVNSNYVYAVNELKEFEGKAGGSVSSFKIINENGDLEPCDIAPTFGQDPCHVAVCGNGNILIVSNFMTGSVCAYQTDSTGKISKSDFVQHKGASVNPVRQKGPHAHSCISIRGTNKVLIPDLGIDQVIVYELIENGKLRKCDDEIFHCPPGSGPRYGEFHPKLDIFYLINELASSISVLTYNRDKGGFSCIQEISTLPELCENICADLHITASGKFLYASNRGHNSITGYVVNPKDGTLEKISTTACGGKTPRNFTIDSEEQFVLVGNQDSDCIVLFEIDKLTGNLSEVDRLALPTPVCICPVKALPTAIG